MKKTTIAALIMLFAALGSCTKGPKGDPGPAGQAGTNGTNGTNGNANVDGISGVLTSSMWLWDATNLLDYVNISDSNITADIVATGTVSVFFSNNGGITWFGLPYTFVNSTVTNYWTYSYSVGELSIDFQRSDRTNTNPGTINIKALCISSQQRLMHPGVNWKDYSQAVAALNTEMVPGSNN